MVTLPDDLPVVERVVVRAVVVDANEEVLLFHTKDPTYPELGTWWELPGGGLEDGETVVDAAIRELREETGMVIEPAQVRPPTWQRLASFRYRGTRHLQHESVCVVRLSEPGPAVDGSLRVGFEDEDYFAYRWWPVDEVARSCDQFYPRRLPECLPRVVMGERIDEPFELWS